MHMVFTGNPGTAKTTVARLFARIMRENGLLSRGHLVEVGRSDLVGKYVGWTAPAVQKKFKEASGGVLFIDEEYSLATENAGSFGEEAINTIVQEMENRRDELVVIFAGYPDEMEKFLQSNPGLRSRIAFHVPFADYGTEELCQIAKYQASKLELRLTDDAVEKVSEFYLEELADRRSQVVTRFFETEADQMQRALALMTQEDLSSQEALRSFIGRVEALYGLELFAVADEDNVVYTEHTTYMGGSRYAFLSDELSRIRTITTNATYGGGKDICLSLPVQNRVFNGKKLKTCFIEINMDDIVSMLAFNTQEKGTYFSLYYENGENLTGLDFGPVSAKQNLLTFMSRYLTAAETEVLSGNFRNGTAGKALFSFSGARQMFYYSPIPETGWMITVLIPENLIYNQIGGIRE
jgi:SpoVK/Ycf46/Vps4 family AAA+-type ATPase